MAKNLDLKDWKIIEQLCADARLSHNQIAKRVGLSKNTVTYRIDRLLKRGTISGFFAIIDHQLLGFSFYEVFLKITASPEKEQQLIAFLQQHPHLLVLDRLSGEWNFVMEFGCQKIKTMYAILDALKSNFFDILESFELHP